MRLEKLKYWLLSLLVLIIILLFYFLLRKETIKPFQEMDEYANVLIIYDSLTVEQLAEVREILKNGKEFEEIDNTFFIRTEYASQEEKINKALKLMNLKYIFAHTEYREASYIGGNNIPDEQFIKIADIFER
jgi:hypothetical protein